MEAEMKQRITSNKGPFIYKVTGGGGEFMGSPKKYLSVKGVKGKKLEKFKCTW